MRNRHVGWIAALLALALGFGVGRLRPVDETVASGGDAEPALKHAPPTPAAASDAWQRLVANGGTRTDARDADAGHRIAATPLPTGPFGASVAQLEQLAQAGNAAAAAALAQGFRDCQFFRPATSEQEATAQVEDAAARELAFTDQLADEVQRIAAQQGKQVDIPRDSARAALQRQLQAQHEQSVRCTGVDPDAARNWPFWAQRAAQLGDLDAELSFWQLMIQHADVSTPDELVAQKRIALDALQDALHRGDPRALAAIGKTLALGLFAEPDPYAAYAYLSAAAQAPTADSSTLPWLNAWHNLFVGGNTHNYLERELRDLEASLSTSQRIDAREAGLLLYQRCCSRMGR